ncbi:MAG: Sir2 family NAD-dependent protein deacetylase [Planctomycetaceae bacterium]
MQESLSLNAALKQASDAVRNADALLIGAGAGMGVDSGLPDFRGTEGFWKAYPPFHGRQFAELSTPHWFSTDVSLAWGFFGHRLHLYRTAVPHAGFDVLLKWARAMPAGYFVFTSNVDGQFQKAGFPEDRILECHGSIHFLQCHQGCGRPIWPADQVQIDVDDATIRARSVPPACPDCGQVARPNILMFGDWQWDESRTAAQQARYQHWLRQVRGRRIVAVELGAGTAIPTVRHECEDRASQLIRINPRDSQTPAHGVSLPLGAREALVRIDAYGQIPSEARLT